MQPNEERLSGLLTVHRGNPGSRYLQQQASCAIQQEVVQQEVVQQEAVQQSRYGKNCAETIEMKKGE